MAISANAIWNLRASATGTAGKNGGFFVTGASGTNYSLQDGAQYALTGVTSVGAGNVILTASAAADMVGNGLFVVSGTNFTINAWFEITSVVAGVSITVSTNAAGTAICTGVGASGVVNIGGANHLNSALADDMFESATAGNIYYIKSGTYTVGESIALARDGTTTAPIKIIGYTATQGDSCQFSSRPVLNLAAFSITLGSYYWLRNISITGTAVNVVVMGAYNKILGCKIINKSTTAARNAISSSTNFVIQSSELCSYYGNAVDASDDGIILGCYIHSSTNGIEITISTQTLTLEGNLIVDCAKGIVTTSGITGSVFTVLGNTICSPMNSVASAIGAYGLHILGTLATATVVCRNIFAGLTTGISAASNAKNSFGGYNNFYGNTTDVSTWAKDSTDTAINTSFANASVVNGSTATTAASNRLVQSGATFISSGVVAGRDTVYIASGTGVAAGFYGILSVDSETQITVDITLTANATADKMFAITVGRNFAVGPAMKSLGGPPVPCEQTVSYAEQGAVQRREKGTTISTFIG